MASNGFPPIVASHPRHLASTLPVTSPYAGIAARRCFQSTGVRRMKTNTLRSQTPSLSVTPRARTSGGLVQPHHGLRQAPIAEGARRLRVHFDGLVAVLPRAGGGRLFETKCSDQEVVGW